MINPFVALADAYGSGVLALHLLFILGCLLLLIFLSDNKKVKCCFCKEKIKGDGNNALPMNSGRCCDKCNKEIVFKERNRGVAQE